MANSRSPGMKRVAEFNVGGKASIGVYSDMATIAKRVALFGKRGVPRAEYRSINRALSKMKTNAKRGLSAKFNLKAMDVGKTLAVKKANITRMNAALIGRGPQIPIYDVKGAKRQTKIGVRINTGSGSRVIRGAFIATMDSGHTGVFKRVTGGKKKRVRYINDKGQRQTSFLPIRELLFPSTAHMIVNPKFAGPLFRLYIAEFKDQFRKQLNFEFDKGRR